MIAISFDEKVKIGLQYALETLVGRSDRNQRKCHEKRLERRDAKFLANLW